MHQMRNRDYVWQYQSINQYVKKAVSENLQNVRTNEH